MDHLILVSGMPYLFVKSSVRESDTEYNGEYFNDPLAVAEFRAGIESLIEKLCRDRLKNMGIPTIFSCDIPIEAIDFQTISDIELCFYNKHTDIELCFYNKHTDDIGFSVWKLSQKILSITSIRSEAFYNDHKHLLIRKHQA